MPRWLQIRLPYIALAIAAVAVGLAVHRRAIPLPMAARDVLGDALWAAMMVWSIGALAPAWRTWRRAAAALAICATVELAQLLQSPVLNDIRRTPVGHLILGSDFDIRDLSAYAAGVVVATLLERAAGVWRPRGREAHGDSPE